VTVPEIARQFICSSLEVDPFHGWVTRRHGALNVQLSPDLQFTQFNAPNCKLSLIGYIVDPWNPSAGDAEILGEIAGHCTGADSLVRYAGRLAGRWVLIADSGDYSVLCHDAGGLRQVFYSEEMRVCASQASTAARVFPFVDSSKEFLETEFAQNNSEYWWPGDTTPYRGVECLLPNHYLDLRSWRSKRYWPNESIGECGIEAAASTAADILAGELQAVALRFPLALPITAGWDSRVILAACRRAQIEPHCYTLQFGKLHRGSQDIAVPGRLLRHLGLRHQVIPCPNRADPEFLLRYNRQADPTHEEAAAIAQGLLSSYPAGRVSLSGHCSEMARCYYHPKPEKRKIDAGLLADLTTMDRVPFVLNAFAKWLAGAQPASEASGIELLDLFYLEQRVGRWAANGQAQWDIVHERFTPFNCRPLLETLLSVDADHRKPPAYALYRRVISLLSSDALREPINPDDNRAPEARWRTLARQTLRAIGQR
jgi:hypothetical protein